MSYTSFPVPLYGYMHAHVGTYISIVSYVHSLGCAIRLHYHSARGSTPAS